MTYIKQETSVYQKKLYLLIVSIVPLLLNGCSNHSDSSSNKIEATTLDDYETVVSVEDNALVIPTIIKYNNPNLFVYDRGKSSILELDKDGNIVKRYGRNGRGPGEFLRVKNILPTKNYLYAVDTRQYFIHKYNRKGELVSTMDYGEISGLGRPNVPSPPISMSLPHAEVLNNYPSVTLHGNVLLSLVRFSQSVQSLYKLVNWEGNHIANIGEIPTGSAFTINYEQLRTNISNREVPSSYRPKAFPVNNQANPDEYYLIYSAFPKIIKYNTVGEKLWEKEISGIHEIDSIKTRFFETMEGVSPSKGRMPLNYYKAGTSDSDGNLFLAMDTNPLLIHRFNNSGNLTHRYKLISQDVDILPILDIDFTKNRILVVTEEGEIRAYPFK